MKRLLIGLSLWLVWPLSLIWGQDAPVYQWQAEPFEAAALFEVDLIKVVDGDTAYFLTEDQREVKARFLLIDTPELRHPKTGKQALADEAKARVTDLLEDADQIYLEYDIGSRLDKYQRDLVYVWADEVLVQEVLAAEGLADVTYIYPPNTRYLDFLDEAKDFAQAERSGLWGLPSAFGEIDDGDSDSDSDSGSVVKPFEGGVDDATVADSTVADSGELQTVYIAPLSGAKYHLDEHCRGLRKAASVTDLSLAEALSLGYELCGYEK